LILVDLLLAVIPDNQFKHNDGHAVRRRNKVLSTKVSVDFHKRFNLLAEYLFKNGLSETFTPSALSHDIIEDTAGKYQEGLAAYENSQSLNNESPIANRQKLEQEYYQNCRS
jgi:hypothetical protein